MTSSPVYVGLDCGGSSTRLLAVDERGRVVFRGFSGPANLTSTPRARLVTSLRDAAADCLPATHVCGAFAGLITDDTHELALELLRESFPGARLRAEPDYAAALFACDPSTDVCVIAGTGSLVCSIHDSRLVKSGGRGFILGDDGSASQIGKRALKAYLDDPATTPRQIREAAVDMFGESTEAQIIQRVHRAASSPALLSRLAKPTGLAAQHGDAVAQEMIRTDLKLLAAILARHTRKYPKKAPMIKLGLAGGLWKSSRVFSEIFLQEVRPLVGQTVEAEVCRRPPVEGAVALAKEIEFGN